MTESINHKLQSFLPAQKKVVYSPVGKCIYCNSEDGLTLEHVIPYGLGGRIELPEASCSECAKITSNFERTCLRTMYGPLRLLYEMPSRRKKKRPSTLPLRIKRTPKEEWSYIEVEREKYPFLILFPYFIGPLILTNPTALKRRVAATDRFWIRGASPAYIFKDLLENLTQELNVHSIMPEAKAHVPEFCQLLAKIAHSFAVGELGYGSFESYLLPSILQIEFPENDLYIGSLEEDEPPSTSLHELSFDNSLRDDQVVVRVRLLSKLGTPTYIVVVGQKIDKQN